MSDAHYDVLIAGGGPVGLCFAAMLRDLDLRVGLVEPQQQAALAEAPYDGREIALTLKSMAILRAADVWRRLPREEIATLRGARIYNGDSLRSLDLQAPNGAPQIGSLVSNHWLRRAAYEAARSNATLRWLNGTQVTEISAAPGLAQVRLEDGRRLTARLVVAADSRFSATRRALGIAARMRDFGKSMLVCRMSHEVEQHGIAWEWFGHHQTLALLPLAERLSSVVLTLPSAQVRRLQELPGEAFERELEERFQRRLGRMQLRSERFAYPLVAVYPSRFIAERYAVIGDAAVGMHPVTAHGFNFGLSGQSLLARLIGRARQAGQDIGDESVLRRYERAHRRATLPLYLATNAVVRLYTDESAPGRLAREALLRLAHRLPPVGSALSRLLMQGERTPFRPFTGGRSGAIDHVFRRSVS